jgi:hypothetical protein
MEDRMFEKVHELLEDLYQKFGLDEGKGIRIHLSVLPERSDEEPAKSKIIGWFVNVSVDLDAPFNVEAASTVMDLATEHGCNLFISPSPNSGCLRAEFTKK